MGALTNLKRRSPRAVPGHVRDRNLPQCFALVCEWNGRSSAALLVWTWMSTLRSGTCVRHVQEPGDELRKVRRNEFEIDTSGLVILVPRLNC